MKRTTILKVIIACIGAILLWLLICYVFANVSPKVRELLFDTEVLNATNSLFATLAFLCVVITLIQQRKVLEIQQHQIFDQNQKYLVQRFESSFFKLLEHQQIILKNISYKEMKGTCVFSHFYRSIEIHQLYDLESGFGIKDLCRVRGIPSYYDIDPIKIFNPYFQHLCYLIKFIDETTSIDNLLKFKYIDLIRAQFSEDELLILFYYGLNKPGNSTLKPLIEKYSFFRNLNLKEIADDKHLIEYKETAYK